MAETSIPNSIAQISEFAEIVASATGGEQTTSGVRFAIAHKLRNEGHDLQSLAPNDLVMATWQALRDTDAGLMIDRGEGSIMTQACRWALEGHESVIRAHPALTRRNDDPVESEPFVWEDESVEQGLEAFSRWLNINRSARVCMLNLPTDMDVFFSAYCHPVMADLAVSQFELAGLSTSIIDGVDLPTLTASSVTDAVESVIDTLGFLPSGERVGRFHRELSDRFSIVIQIDQNRSYRRRINIALGAAHHETNELAGAVMHDERMVRTFPTAYLHTETVETMAEVTDAISGVVNASTELTEREVELQIKKQSQSSIVGRLINRKWPKKADKELRIKQEMGAKASERGDDPFYILQGEIAASVLDYLDEHEIPHGDNR